MGTTRRTWFRRTFYEYKTYSELKALEVILKNLGFVCSGLNANKATGYDGIPPKALKASSKVIAPTVCNMVNTMVEQSLFPDPLKKAEVAPIYKQVKSRLSWTNFRPVSVLTCLSKVFEIIMTDQMEPHLHQIFSIYLSAYRKMFGCHSVLIHSTDIWKKVLDDKKYVGIIMSDLSKAFDCIPHSLLLEKLKYYRFSPDSVNLIQSYLSNRYQRVKLGQVASSWAKLSKGVPQGSVIGPQCFNLHINDLLLDLAARNIIPSNYADDNSTSVVCDTKSEALNRVKESIVFLGKWFADNLMKANIEKFQFMLLCQNANENKETHVIQVDSFILSSQDSAKLLGIHIDKQLSFNGHVKLKCKQANSKLQVLKRLSQYLTEECKLVVISSFIVSHFIYCAPLFQFCSKYFRDKMEKILERGLRFVFNDYSSDYEELLSKADMCSIEILREKAVICEMYKCLHGLGPWYMREIFTATGVETRKGIKFEQPRVRTSTYGLHSLRYQGPKLWNNLSLDVKTSKDLNSLKTKLATYEGTPCKCAMCRR